MRTFPRFKALAWLAAAGLALSATAFTPAHAQDNKRVSVLSIVEHPALDAVRDGVHEALAEAGFEEGKNLKWEYQSAQGNTATAAQIARKFVGQRPDVIVAIATPAAQAVAAATKDVPLVFSAVTDPVAAKLTPDWGASGTNVTGMSDQLPLDSQIDLILQIVPNAKSVGMVYNPSEANSAIVEKEMRELLKKRGIELFSAGAPRTVDVGQAAASLSKKADVFYNSTDNTVVSAYESFVKVARDAKIPLVAADGGSVERGAVAALGIDYHDMGVQTGKMVVRILNGEKPGDLAVETSDNLDIYVNPGEAEKQGATLPEDLVKSAAKVY